MANRNFGEEVGQILSVLWNHPVLTGAVLLICIPPILPAIVYSFPLLLSTSLCVVVFRNLGSKAEEAWREMEAKFEGCPHTTPSHGNYQALEPWPLSAWAETTATEWYNCHDGLLELLHAPSSRIEGASALRAGPDLDENSLRGSVGTLACSQIVELGRVGSELEVATCITVPGAAACAAGGTRSTAGKEFAPCRLGITAPLSIGSEPGVTRPPVVKPGAAGPQRWTNWLNGFEAHSSEFVMEDAQSAPNRRSLADLQRDHRTRERVGPHDGNLHRKCRSVDEDVCSLKPFEVVGRSSSWSKGMGSRTSGISGSMDPSHSSRDVRDSRRSTGGSGINHLAK